MENSTTDPATAEATKRSPGSRASWTIGVVVGFWGLIWVLSASQLHLAYLAEGIVGSWQRFFLFEFSQWCFWIIPTLAILRLGRRFPLTRHTWRASLPIHVLAYVLIVGLHSLVVALVVVWVQPYPGRTEYAFSKQLLDELLSLSSLDLLLYCAVLGVVYALEYAARFREGELRAAQLEAQLAQAQLDALKMQLHPHFLFNTINAIAMLVRKQENKMATDMLAGLSDLLRRTLDTAGVQEVTLQQELDYIRCYLAIEQIRFQDRLTVSMAIAPDVSTARVPTLLLQPLVENAVRHGISKRMAAGLIEIRAKREGGQLHLSVRDDGPGFPEAGGHVEGVGLSNVQARLARRYGTHHEMWHENVPEGGARVTLLIPFIRSR